jgi:hypothetical protein
LADLGIFQLSSVFSITGFHSAVQQKFRMIDATAGRGMIATVQSLVNLAELGMVQLSSVSGHTDSSMVPRPKFSMMEGMVQLSRVYSLTGSPYCLA